MLKNLNAKQIRKFVKKYLPEWAKDIKEVNLIYYKGTKEYLVNNHYLVSVKRFKVT